MGPSRLMLALVAVLAALLLSGCEKSQTDALSAAKARIAKGEDAGAEIDLKNFLQRHPESGEARYLLGLQIQKRGDTASALIELQRASDLKYPDTIVVPAIAQALLTQGKFKQIIDEFAKLELSDTVANAELQGLVAQAMYSDGDVQAATELINKAAAAAPAHEQIQLTKASFLAQAGNIAPSLAVLDALIANRPNSHLAWTMKGQVQGITPATADAAMISLRKAVELKPTEIPPYTGLITLALRKGDIEGAKRDLESLKKIAPKQPTTGFYDASVAFAEGRHVDAQARYQEILRVLPLHPQVLLAAAENELKLNATAQAETLTAKVLTQWPDNIVARQLQAQVYLRMGQPAKAIASLSSLVDSPRATPQILALAAQAHLLNGNPAAAEHLYALIAKLKPTEPQIRTLLAAAALGRKPDAWVFDELRSISAEDTGIAADMALVSTYVRRGLSGDALKVLSDIDRKRPKDPSHRVLRGQILANTNDLAGARAAFEDALAVSPDNLKAVVALASLDIRDNKPDAARDRLKALLKRQPRNAKAMLALAEALGSDPTQVGERKRLLEASVQADPTDEEALTALVALHRDMGDGKSALVAAHAAVAASPQSVELLAILAWCQQRVGETSQALSTYGKIVAIAPRNPRGHIGATEVHLRTGDLEGARRSIERGLQALPGNSDLLGQSIALHLQKRQADQALQIARTLQKEQPNAATGWILEGEIEASQQHWAGAATNFRKALDKSPPAGLLPKYLHVLKLGGKSAESKSFAEEMLKANPNNVELLFYMADSAQQGGDLNQARRLYEELLKRNGDHLLALNNLATVLLAERQPGALALARRAVLLAPREAAVLDTLAQALASEGKLDEAVTTQGLAVRRAPNQPDFRLTLAKLLISKGDRAAAKQELTTLADLGKGYQNQAEVTQLLTGLAGKTAAR